MRLSSIQIYPRCAFVPCTIVSGGPMLQNIRDNSQGWIAKTIIGVIMVLLALTGFDAIFRATSNSDKAAEVNGEKITQNEVAQAAELQVRQLRQKLGSDFDASMLNEKMMRESALKNLIDRQLLLQGAHDAGFAFSQASLDQLILQTPDFQVAGKFSPERFDQVIRQMNYSRLQFRQMLETEMLVAQLRAGLSGSGFVTDAEVQAFARLEKQTRDFASVTLKADTKSVQISEDELKAYFDAHADQYMTPEQVVIEYVELKKDAFFDQVSVSDADLQDLYHKQIANLTEQRHAAHILIEADPKAGEDQAKAKADDIRKRLEKGEDFAALAKEFSADPGSASQGGDLGFAGPGVYDPAFEKALYALKQGEISEPVKTQYGWHVIKLLGVQAPEIPSFDSSKESLIRELKTQRVEQLFVEATKKLEDMSFEASDLAQPAQELGLKVQTSKPFGREGGEGVSANRQILQAAFSPEILDDGANSGALELDPDTVVVLRAKEHLKPKPQTFQDVSAGIREELTKERATEATKMAGEQLVAQLKKGEQARKDWNVTEAATRAQEGVDPAVLQAVFRAPKPESKDKPVYAGVALANGDYVVLRLDGVSAPEDALSDEDKASYKRFLASRAGAQDYSAYRQQLEAKADIKRY